MKILIVSDTHRRDENLKKVIEQNVPLDMFIHLGDAEGSEDRIWQWLNPDCRIEMVLGNNDFFSMLDREREVRIGKYRALLTHGHYYGVSVGMERLKEEARARGCNIAMFGHTHRPFLETVKGVLLVNPGSLSYPRQEGRQPSYLLLTAQADGTLDFSQNYLKN